MGRILAIDYGKVRCGLAITDPFKIIASGAGVVGPSDLLSVIDGYLREADSLEALVVGEPKRLHNEASEVEGDIQKFLQKVRATFPNLPVHRVDERFTSKIAQQAMIQGGMKKSKRMEKGRVDEIAAVLLLQSFLDQRG